MKQNGLGTALIIIDIINDFNFYSGDKLLHHTKSILPNLIQLKQYAKQNQIPVIYVNDHYGSWESNFKNICDHCRNEKNQEIIDKMVPTEGDFFLIKPKLSAFFHTGLASLLRELHVTHVILSGIAGNICVLFTANDAHMRDFTVSVPKNCIASNEEYLNEQALELMKNVLSTNIDEI
ncbi:isochorismatase family cysteine hydrolase [Aquibacillus kalidii]|uniref:isochorismatase family cysteine hydrolase n=1 Tax=Aquibacillus kalidii TaxID=2762597 RepID=UPI0016461E6D|nr:isochorismatase family cysteine hydrolase [Aquibacillus kalidii]